MALPKLLREIFENDGAGPKLREDIIPVDTALSATSENAVQNKTVKEALDGKLSLTGGTFANQIVGLTFQDSLHLSVSNNHSFIEISGGTGWHGFADKLCSQLILSGGEGENGSVEAGVFAINAANITNGCALFGYPNGALTWGGHDVLRLEGTKKSADGSWWYRKYSDGYIEQGGVFDNGSNARGISTAITFLAPFSSSIYSAQVTPGAINPINWDGTVIVRERTATSMTIAFWGNGTAITARYLYWFACGY